MHLKSCDILKKYLSLNETHTLLTHGGRVWTSPLKPTPGIAVPLATACYSAQKVGFRQLASHPNCTFAYSSSPPVLTKQRLVLHARIVSDLKASGRNSLDVVTTHDYVGRAAMADPPECMDRHARALGVDVRILGEFMHPFNTAPAFTSVSRPL